MKYVVLALVIAMMALSACQTEVANEDILPSDDPVNNMEQNTPALPQPPSETPNNPENEAAAAIGDAEESNDDEDIDGAMDSINDLENW